jgi:hypothetical protein
LLARRQDRGRWRAVSHTRAPRQPPSQRRNPKHFAAKPSLTFLGHLSISEAPARILAIGNAVAAPIAQLYAVIAMPFDYRLYERAAKPTLWYGNLDEVREVALIAARGVFARAVGHLRR